MNPTSGKTTVVRSKESGITRSCYVMPRVAGPEVLTSKLSLSSALSNWISISPGQEAEFCRRRAKAPTATGSVPIDEVQFFRVLALPIPPITTRPIPINSRDAGSGRLTVVSKKSCS